MARHYKETAINSPIDLKNLQISDSQRGVRRGFPWKTLLVVLLLLALLAVGVHQAWEKYRPRAVVTVVQVVTKAGKVEVGGGSFKASGWVEPDPFPDYASTLVEGWVTALHAVEGDHVEQGQLVAELYDADFKLTLRQEQAARNTLDAERRYLDKQLSVDEALLASGAVDELLVEKSRAEIMRLDASLAEADLRIELAQRNLDRCKITAPLAGVVLDRYVSVGSHVVPGGHIANLFSIYDPSSTQVRVDVNLFDVPKASVGTECRITVESAPEQSFKGRVHRINHLADNQKNTVQYKVKILEPSEALKPEVLCRVEFLAEKHTVDTGDTTYLTFVPEKALVQDGAGYALFIAKGPADRAVAAKIAVTLGEARSGELRQVQTGVDPSMKVIVTNLAQLKDGDPIRAVSE